MTRKTFKQELDALSEKKSIHFTDRGLSKCNSSRRVGFIDEGIKVQGINILSFCPTNSCNLFHHHDMCNIFINMRLRFELQYWSDSGRNHFCVFKVYTDTKKDRDDYHYVCVWSDGLACSDEKIAFSNSFPEKIKFNICKRMAMSVLKADRDDNDYFRVEALRNLIRKCAFGMKDLENIMRVYRLLDIGKYKCSSNAYSKEEIEENKKECERIRTSEMYVMYKNHRRRVRPRNLPIKD